MKRTRSIFIATLLFTVLAFVPCNSYAAGIGVSIDGSSVAYSTDSGAPFVDDANRVQVPLRQTLEQFGATVTWEASTKTAYIKKDGITVKVIIGKSYIYRGSSKISNDTAATIRDGRTYLPIRVVLEAFGAGVSWDSKNRVVLIETTPPDATSSATK